MKLLITVTHLLGTGHLSRALTLARGFVQAGHNVHVLTGGMPVLHLDKAGIDLIQLPPLRSDGVNFTRLLDQNDEVATDDVYMARRTQALAALHDIAPDVLITELYPFGRRSLRDEFDALLQAAKSMAQPPLVLSSIRDILAPPSKPAKAVFADDKIEAFYDGVLVHSDPKITPLGLSWPVSDMLASKLHYTGFVAPAAPAQHPDQAGQNEILISAGGGNVGQALFAAAKGAARLDPDRIWRILVGGQNQDAQIKSLQADSPDNLRVGAARPDFRAMLNHAAASLSMCGYNTALDVLQTGVPAVFVPFDAGDEVEQSLRARALSKTPSITVLPDADLTPERLFAAVQEGVTSGKRPIRKQGFDGVAGTVEHVTDLLRSRGAK